jgi:bifunctional ADP-heptose synthase (sugar kinase/adenylyltransferase)
MKILVVGEKCIDKFVYCKAERFSPEAPVPVLNPVDIVENDGMAGNVVRNLLSLYPEIEIQHWYQSESITKTRLVEKKSNHMFIRIDEGEKEITPLDLTTDMILSLKEYDFVIVSDYAKGFLSDSDLINIGSNSKLSILDSKRKITTEIVQAFTFIKLNESESQRNTEFLDYGNILITLGSKGVQFCGQIYPSPDPQETIDVSGAGDTFTASFILNFSKTGDIEDSIIWANKMAAIVVSKRGVATPN